MADLPERGFLAFLRGQGARQGKDRSGAGALTRRGFVLLGLVLVGAIWATDWMVIGMAREAAIADFRTAAINLAKGMAAQTTRSFATIDTAVLGLREALVTIPNPMQDRLQAHLAAQAAQDMLTEQRRYLPGVQSLAVFTADGRVASQSGPWPQAGMNASAEDFFQYFRGAHGSAGGRGLFVGAPHQRIAGAGWTSVLARRLIDQRGAFIGVVAADISLAALEDFYRTAMPPHRMLMLARQDGTILVRFPQPPGPIGGRVPDHAAWYAAVAAGGGSYLAASPFDGVPMLAAVQTLHGMPLVIEASISQDDILAGWRMQRFWLVLGGVAASAGTLLVVRLIARQVQDLAVKTMQIETARGQLDLAMSNISQGLCFYDGEQRLIVCNSRYGEIYGLPRWAMRRGVAFEDVVDCCYASVGINDLARDDFVMSRAAVARAGVPHHSVLQLGNGRTVSIQQQPMPDGGWVATHEDITERRRAEDQISFMARHDMLTGLPNRSLLQERIGEAFARAGRGRSFAMLFLDLDRFKAVNDTLGHAVGDELLRAVAARLRKTVRDTDTVARLGGDEFVVLQSDLQAPDNAAVLAERIIESVGAPYTIAGHEVAIGVSIGIDIATSDRASSEDVMKQADLALYTAKAEGRGTFRFYSPQMNAQIQQRHTIEADLRQAILREEFVLFYQPIVSTRTGRACGFEALLRWNHPRQGMVGPDDFIPIAEECGLIIPIGEWVLAAACRQAATWPEDIHVAVNLSPVQFRATNLADVVRAALDESGLAAERLEVEITESVLLHSNDRNLAILHQLRALGISIAMDDFGVGYSSLSYLRAFPFDRVKIDRCFVQDLSARQDAVYVVRAIVGLCRDLGIRTTAEGVETAEHLAILLAEGCTELQGYFFSRPREASRLEGLLGRGRLIALPDVQEKRPRTVRAASA